MLDRQMQDKKDLSSYSYYTSSEDAPGEGVRLVPKAEVKEDPKDPSSSESSSDDDDMKERRRNVKILMKRVQSSLNCLRLKASSPRTSLQVQRVSLPRNFLRSQWR